MTLHIETLIAESLELFNSITKHNNVEDIEKFKKCYKHITGYLDLNEDGWSSDNKYKLILDNNFNNFNFDSVEEFRIYLNEMLHILNSKHREKTMQVDTNSVNEGELSSFDFTSNHVMSIENFSHNISDSSSQYDRNKPKELIVENNKISDFSFNKEVKKQLLYELNGFTDKKLNESFFQNNSQDDSSVQFVCIDQIDVEVVRKENNPFLSSIYDVNTENILKNKDNGSQTEIFLYDKNSNDISCQTDDLNIEGLYELMKSILKK